MEHAVCAASADCSDLASGSGPGNDFRARTSCNTGSLSGRARYQPGTVARAATALQTRATAFTRVIA